MRRLLLVIAVVAMVSGCGGASPGIGETAARSLEPKIADVRAAAEAGRPDAVKAKLAELRAEVDALREQGKLTEAGAARILGAAGDVEENLTLITTTTAQPRSATTQPRAATTTQPDNKDDEEKKKDEEKKEGEKGG